MKLSIPTTIPNQHPTVVEKIKVQKIFFFNSGVRIAKLPNTTGKMIKGDFCCNKNAASSVSAEYKQPNITGRYRAENKIRRLVVNSSVENFFPGQISQYAKSSTQKIELNNGQKTRLDVMPMQIKPYTAW